MLKAKSQNTTYFIMHKETNGVMMDQEKHYNPKKTDNKKQRKSSNERRDGPKNC